MDSTPFYVALFIHLVGLVLAFGSVMVTDLFGVLWIFDRVRFPQIVRVSGITEKFIWTGWAIMVAAGLPLIYYKGEIDNLMIIKLFFVVLIAVNGVFLYRLHKRLKGHQKIHSVPNIVIFRLGLALVVSQIGWWGAFLIGFLHRHVQSVIQWPDAPWLACAEFTGSLLIVWGIGELVIKGERAS